MGKIFGDFDGLRDVGRASTLARRHCKGRPVLVWRLRVPGVAKMAEMLV
jgi:hypothetical protein